METMRTRNCIRKATETNKKLELCGRLRNRAEKQNRLSDGSFRKDSKSSQIKKAFSSSIELVHKERESNVKTGQGTEELSGKESSKKRRGNVRAIEFHILRKAYLL